MSKVWEGDFTSFEEASKKLGLMGTSGNVFDSPEWLSRHKVKTLHKSINNARPSSIALLIAGMRKVRVVELGGGSGWVYKLLSELQMDIAEYVLIERPAVVKFFQEKTPVGLEFKTIHEFLANPTLTPSIFYANSTLQYFPDNTVLEKLVKTSQPEYILFDELPLTQGEDWFSIQINSDLPIVYRFISEAKIISLILSLGYKLISKTPTSGDKNYSFPNMGNFQKEKQIDTAWSILFHKTTILMSENDKK